MTPVNADGEVTIPYREQHSQHHPCSRPGDALGAFSSLPSYMPRLPSQPCAGKQSGEREGTMLSQASNGWRPGMLITILQCTGQPPTTKNDRSNFTQHKKIHTDEKCSVVINVENVSELLLTSDVCMSTQWKETLRM